MLVAGRGFVVFALGTVGRRDWPCGVTLEAISGPAERPPLHVHQVAAGRCERGMSEQLRYVTDRRGRLLEAARGLVAEIAQLEALQAGRRRRRDPGIADGMHPTTDGITEHVRLAG